MVTGFNCLFTQQIRDFCVNRFCLVSESTVWTITLLRLGVVSNSILQPDTVPRISGSEVKECHCEKWAANLPALKESIFSLKYSGNMGKNDSKLSLTWGESSWLIIPVVVTSDRCDLFSLGGNSGCSDCGCSAGSSERFSLKNSCQHLWSANVGSWNLAALNTPYFHHEYWWYC